MQTIKRGLDAHLGNRAVARIGTGVVIEVVKLIHLTVVDSHRLVEGVARRMEAAVRLLEGVVECEVGFMVAVDPVLVSDGLRRGHITPGILKGLNRDLVAPLRYTLIGASANLERMIGVVREVGHIELNRLTGRDGVHHAVDHDVIAGGAVDLVPRELDARGGKAVLRSLEGRGLEGIDHLVRTNVTLVLKARDLKGLLVRLDVGLGELHIELGRGDDLLLGETLLLDLLGSSRRGTVVEVRLLVVEVNELPVLGLRLVKGLLRVNLDLLEIGIAVLGLHGLGLAGDVHDERGGAVLLIALVAALGLLSHERSFLAVHVRGELGGNVIAVANVALLAVLLVGLIDLVLDEGARILEQVVLTVTRNREELDIALGAINLVRAVVGLVHRDDGVGLYKHRELPQRGVEVIEHLACTILLTGKVIDPDVLLRVARQVNAIANIAAVVLRIGGVLIDRRHKEILTKRVLVLSLGALGVIGIIGEQNGADDGHTLVAVTGIDVRSRCGRSVDVGHELRLELEVHAADAGVRVAMGLRSLDIGTPAVHVEHERRKGFPLIVTRCDDGSTTKDAVHVGSDVGVACKALTDERGNVEADVLPVTTGLIARPNATKALRARPTIEGDDVGAEARLSSHDVIRGLGAVKCHGVARTDPSNIGLKSRYAALFDLVLKVAQKLPLSIRVGIGLQVRLRPQARGNTPLVGVVGELLEVVHVGRNRLETLLAGGSALIDAAGLAKAVLAITGAVAVIGQEIAQGHIVLKVVIKAMAGGELLGEVSTRRDVLRVDRRAVPVQALNMRVGGHGGTRTALLVLDLAGVRIGRRSRTLYLLLAIPILRIGRPHIAVPCVEMANVERVLGKQHGVAGDLIVTLEQILSDRCGGFTLGGICHKIIGVELVLFMRRHGCITVGLAKVIRAVGKGVAQNAVSLAGPVERVGRSNAAIDPIGLVGNVDGVARMNEAPVLGAAAKEVLTLMLDERLDGGALLEIERRCLLHDHLAVTLDGHFRRGLVELDGGLTACRGDYKCPSLIFHARLWLGVL